MGILSVDLTKAFDTVSHNIILRKLNDLGIRRDIWLWLKNYLTERKHFVRINGCDSDIHIITLGVPQGSVLGLTLFSLFTKDLTKSLRSAKTYLYADDTIYCIAETMDLLTNSLNNVLAELQEWCDGNSKVPHPEKCKAMIMQRKSTFTGPIQALRLGNNIIKWTTSERLLGVQVVLVRSCCKCSEVLHIQVKSTPTHEIPPSEAIRRFLHKSDTAISYIRSDSVGIVQEHAPKKPGKPPCKGWTDCIWAAMEH